MRLFRLALVLCLLCIGIVSQAQTEGTSLDERGYGLYIPSSYDEDGEDELPLLIALHGLGDVWDNFYPSTGFINAAEENDFIVAFPQGYLRQWNDGSIGDHEEDDIQLLRDLVARVDRDYRVDFDRIYLVGFSNGATMTYRAACEAPDLFSGIAAVAGTMRSAQSENCEGAQLPVAIIHGTADDVVSFDGGVYRYAVTSATAFWAIQNECDVDTVEPYSEDNFRNGYGTYLFTDCTAGNFVMLHALEGVGHMWPGSVAYVRNLDPSPPSTDTAGIIWRFFDLAYQESLQAEIAPEVTPETDD